MAANAAGSVSTKVHGPMNGLAVENQRPATR
jgi:hypothetical protein